MARRRYKVLTAAEWDQAAEENSRGDDYGTLADRWGVSKRSIATHLPAALERRRLALAPSTMSAEPPLVAASIPDVADREEATRHWRQAAWTDSQALQMRLREEINAPSPDARAIRALSAGSDALKTLIAIGRNVLEVDQHAADEVLPELIIRELTPEEVAQMRDRQRREDPLAAVEDMFSLEAPEEAECHDVIVENE
ncbi:hypothetical protein JK217_09985 [Gluconobacter kondonii]|uniref:hypothetical protein n=1 Tax=Gluconobacter kondonii TaxID=941463 RepID=UPI001B8AE9F3|nr:hypothetical protein [Gluconobacter kondonii]MBS1078075.1 hypothetical protein [Gluconobacter kondonii]